MKSAPIKELKKSSKLLNVRYAIRGPVHSEAKKIEAEGHRVIKLNIGNPAPFGFETPAEVLNEMIANLPKSEGYSDSKGVVVARQAVLDYVRSRGLPNVGLEDIYLGNGASELIVMAMQALCNKGDEVLVPTPDYPLWTAAVNLSGGKAVHYLCDEKSDWAPDLKDMARKITPKTKAVVVINPNNPTGAVYPRPVLEKIAALARKHNLLVFSDEIYDMVLYDGVEHTSMGALLTDRMVITMGGISKNFLAAGFRAGWMILSGDKSRAKNYIDGLEVLSSMRLCSNVPAQYAIPPCLRESNPVIGQMTSPGGRLYQQRETIDRMLNAIPGMSCTKAKGAFYVFPRMDPKKYPIKNDMEFVLDLLRTEKVLVVHGTGHNWPKPDHFRIVFLPKVEDLKVALERIAGFMQRWKP